MNNINEAQPYHKNPRKITKAQHELLSSSLAEFGDLSGVVVNIRTGEVIGGNQRSSIFKREDAKIEIIERYDTPTKTGTTAIGYVIFGDEKYAYREVDWDEKTAESANIRANKIGGIFDFDILANEFDMELLMQSGFSEDELLNSPLGNLSKLHTVNKGDENSEWIGLPDFDVDAGDLKIIFHFESQEDMDKFDKKYGFDINKKLKSTWITSWPFKENAILKDLKYDTDDEPTEE